jgi:hypothetical protein
MNEEVRRGKIVSERGKFFLEAGRERWELEEGMMIAEQPLPELVGREVEVLLSEPRRYVVGLVAEKLRPILCYIPYPHPLCYIPADPWLFKGVEDRIRVNLAEKFLEEGLITKEIHEKLRVR